MTGKDYLSDTLPRHAWVVTADLRKFYWLFAVKAADQIHQGFQAPAPDQDAEGHPGKNTE